mgnify:CR=1 FL=1
MSIKTATVNGVQTIEIARPEKKNALTRAMYQEMADALVAANADNAVRAVLIQGQPGIFTSGNDIEDFMGSPPRDENAPVFQFMRAMINCDKPIVAAVNGAVTAHGGTLLQLDVEAGGSAAICVFGTRDTLRNASRQAVACALELSRALGGWQVICWALAIALPVMLAGALWLMPASLSGVGAPAWAGLGYVSLFSMLIGFVFWYRGLAQGGIAAVGQLQLLQPLFGLALAAGLLRESVSPAMLAVTVAVIGCVAGARRFSRPR